MDTRRQDSEHYQTSPNGTQWITLERKYQGNPGEIRVDEIDEVIAILRRAQGRPEIDADALSAPGAKSAIVKGAHAGGGK